MTSPLEPTATATLIEMPGLEPDNLLGLLALLGLLRAVEHVEPTWKPRVSWSGPPWVPSLHLTCTVSREDVAVAANRGVLGIAEHYDFEGRKNVDYDRIAFRDFATAANARRDQVKRALAGSLAAEHPPKRSGDGLQAAPLVLMFGQGHQDFLTRLASVPRQQEPERRRRAKEVIGGGASKIAEALFAPWRRADATDAFRWDPQEDQRYALRFGNPSKQGAAPTVHGANRLAAIGFLSFANAPGIRAAKALGMIRDGSELLFVWPIWTPALDRTAIESLLAHPDVLARGELGASLERLRPLGIVEVYRARRIANGKFMNVSRAAPASIEPVESGPVRRR